MIGYYQLVNILAVVRVFGESNWRVSLPVISIGLNPNSLSLCLDEKEDNVRTG